MSANGTKIAWEQLLSNYKILYFNSILNKYFEKCFPKVKFNFNNVYDILHMLTRLSTVPWNYHFWLKIFERSSFSTETMLLCTYINTKHLHMEIFWEPQNECRQISYTSSCKVSGKFNEVRSSFVIQFMANYNVHGILWFAFQFNTTIVALHYLYLFGICDNV